MASNRRNYYRVLHVQPDAPAEVIKACYRTLMSTLRHHPDLGGNHETAALINEAYAVLSDSAARSAYDAARAARSRRGAPRVERRGRAEPVAPAASASSARPATYTGPRCPLCRAAVPARVVRTTRCHACRAPLAPVARPETSSVRADRRGMPRVSKSDWALLHLAAADDGIDVRLRDLSLDGIGFFSGLALPVGARVRVVGTMLDVVGEVVSSHLAGTVYTVHAHLLTAQFAQQGGVFVSATA